MKNLIKKKKLSHFREETIYYPNILKIKKQKEFNCNLSILIYFNIDIKVMKKNI